MNRPLTEEAERALRLVEKLREMVPVMRAHGNKFPLYPGDNDFADAAALMEQAADRLSQAAPGVGDFANRVREITGKITDEISSCDANLTYRGSLLFEAQELIIELSRARAEERESKWQPIETAPKDGARFWAWFPFAKTAYVISWGENVYDREPSWTLDDGESANQTYDPPTHWQPLPSPPTEQEKR